MDIVVLFGYGEYIDQIMIIFRLYFCIDQITRWWSNQITFVLVR